MDTENKDDIGAYKAYVGDEVKKLVDDLKLKTPYEVHIDSDIIFVSFFNESGFSTICVYLDSEPDVAATNLITRSYPSAFVYKILGFSFEILSYEFKNLDYFEFFRKQYVEAGKVAKLFEDFADAKCVLVVRSGTGYGAVLKG